MFQYLINFNFCSLFGWNSMTENTDCLETVAFPNCGKHTQQNFKATVWDERKRPQFPSVSQITHTVVKKKTFCNLELAFIIVASQTLSVVVRQTVAKHIFTFIDEPIKKHSCPFTNVSWLSSISPIKFAVFNLSACLKVKSPCKA